MKIKLWRGHFSPPIAPVLALGLAAATAGAAAPPPSGGQLLQEAPPQPAQPTPGLPPIKIDRPDLGVVAPGEAFLLRAIEVTGATLVDTAKIRAIVAPSEGKRLTIADLQTLAQSITALYQHSGYPFSQAYVPAQTLDDGRVRIAVLEARYDDVVLRNSSRVRDGVPNAVLAELKPGMPVDQASLDRVLLLVSDLPSTQVKGTLRPGKDPGTSELLVDVAPAAPVNGSISADDFGNAATGRERLNAGLNIDNPLHAGDVLAVSAQTAGRGMSYGRLGYTIPLDGPATLADVHASTLGYHLVNGAETALDAHGSATVLGAALERVLLRSTNVNWMLQFGYDKTQLDDHVAVSGINTDRHTADWHLTLTGSIADATGVTNLNAVFTTGQVVYDNATALFVDQSGAQTAGRFDKAVLSVSRLQTLSATTAVYGSLSYQGAGQNLDSAEQMFLGGPASVRAYDNGTLSGSQGNAQTLELRQEISATSNGRWQGTFFLDHAQVQVEKKPFTAGSNGGNLQGAGLGLNWAGPQGWAASAVLSTPVGGTPDLAGRRDSVRAWLQISKGF